MSFRSGPGYILYTPRRDSVCIYAYCIKEFGRNSSDAESGERNRQSRAFCNAELCSRHNDFTQSPQFYTECTVHSTQFPREISTVQIQFFSRHA